MGLNVAEVGMFMLAWIASAILVFAYGHFGQREHLFVLTGLPFLVARIVRHEGDSLPRWLGIVLGLQASIGALCKPHFVLVLAVVELALFLGDRRWRLFWTAEMFALGSLLAAYVLHWLFVPALMRDTYFGYLVPLALEYYYVYHDSMWKIFWSTVTSPLTFGMVASAWCLLRYRWPHNRLLLGLTLASMAGWLTATQQHKAWFYHYIPYLCFGCVTCAVLAIHVGRDLLPRKGWKRSRLGLTVLPFCGEVLACAVLVVALATSLGLTRMVTPSWVRQSTVARSLAKVIEVVNHRWSVWSPSSKLLAPFAEIIQSRTNARDPVLFVTTNFAPPYPLLTQLDRRSASRSGCMPIAFFLGDAARSGESLESRYRSLDAVSPFERRFISEFIEDIRVRKPPLIFVNTLKGHRGCPPNVSSYDYLLQTGILSAITGGGYSSMESFNYWKVYVLNEDHQWHDQEIAKRPLKSSSFQ